MKKVLAKSKKSANTGGGGGGGRGPNAGKPTGMQSGFFKTIKAVKEKELLPCIVFAFSQAKTFTLAESLED
jgi:superfamily II RNA helicase